jgi:hypothetical protein
MMDKSVRFNGVGFKLESEEDEGKVLEKRTHADREKRREKLGFLGTDALHNELDGGFVYISSRTYRANSMSASTVMNKEREAGSGEVGKEI